MKRNKTPGTVAASDKRSHAGATLVSYVFKVLAIILLFGGIYVGFQSDHLRAALGLSPNDDAAVALVSVAVGVVLAAWTAFFGYVLSLLCDIAENGRRE
jgi:hypothetical protein